MSTTFIIIAVLLALFVLVGVTFIMQQIEKTNRQNKELIASLKGQTRNFTYLLNGFPEGFLSRDLKMLVCQCLADGLDQLLRLERGNPQLQQEKRALNEQLAKLQTQTGETAYQPLTELAQIQEVQKLLNSLFNVVQRLLQNKRLNPAQADAYGRQVQRLATRVTLDAALSAAQQALSEGKPRLAIHHYGVAADKMKKDNADGSYTAQIANCEQRRAELEAAASQAPTPTAGAGAVDSDAWKGFNDPKDDPWKKKAVYD